MMRTLEHEEDKATGLIAWSDPRDDIEIGVLMANGRLAPRSFATREEAEAGPRTGNGWWSTTGSAPAMCDPTIEVPSTRSCSAGVIA